MRSPTAKLVLALGLALLTGGEARAELTGRFAAIALSGSDRLAIFALSDPGLSPGTRAQRDRILRDRGFGMPAGVRTHDPLKVSPILSWDPNLNGGLVNDSLSIDGLTFAIDPAAAAVSGLFVGGAVESRTQISLGGPTALHLRYGGMVGRAPAEGLSKAIGSIEACVLHLRNPGLGLHACADALQSEVDLGSSRRLKARTGLSKTFEGSRGAHDLRFELGLTREMGSDAYNQPWVGMKMTSALDSGVATGAMIQLAAPVDGEQVARARIELDAAAILFDRPVSVKVSTQAQSGGQFLGQPREDRIDTLSISTQILPSLEANISLSRLESNAEFFDDQSLGFSLNFRM